MSAARLTGAEGWGAIAPRPRSARATVNRRRPLLQAPAESIEESQATTTSWSRFTNTAGRRRRSRDPLERGGLAKRYQPDWPITNRPLATYRDGTITSHPKPPNENKSPKTVSLTPAETRVLTLLTTYQTLAGIGSQLGIARPTVKTHVQNIYKKLGATKRAEAVRLAESAGLLPRS